VSGDYHEYAFGSKFDADGNIWIVLCLTGSFDSRVPFRGWALRVTPDGKTIPTTSGVRSPGGIGFDAAGNVLYTDNQGPWNGSCALKHLVPGDFVGHPGGFKWYDLAPEMGEKPAEPKSGSRMAEEVKRIPRLRPPVIMFPYDLMGKSAAGVVCDTSDGKFGPFAGQVFVSDQSPVLQAANLSPGAHLVAMLSTTAARAMGDADVEIVEVHHRKKKDAPSGTALMLARAVQEGRGAPSRLVKARDGDTPRQQGDIGVVAVRGGDVVGEHTVTFFVDGERVELVHRVSDRGIFARGALLAARFLVGRPAGRVTMQDVLRARLA
jgi:hypothetical protein